MGKKLPQIIIIFFLAIFIFQIAGLIFLLVSPTPSKAEIPLELQVAISGEKSIMISSKNNSIGQYIRDIYNYSLGVVGILATVVMMIGGIVWITAGGNQTRVGEAKAWIGASLSGLVLALASYTILAAVSPNLVNFKTPFIPSPNKQEANEANVDLSLGCCDLVEGGCRQTPQANCLINSGTDDPPGTWDQNKYCGETRCLAKPGCCAVSIKAPDIMYMDCQDGLDCNRAKSFDPGGLQGNKYEYFPDTKCHTDKLKTSKNPCY